MICGMFAPYAPRLPHEPRAPLPAGFVLRAAVDDDLDAIARLTAQRNATALDQCLEGTKRQYDRDTELGNLTAVAEVEGNVVGFGRCRRVDHAADGDGSVPAGWYLLGVIITPQMRRRGIGSEITRFRLEWARERASEVFYFANSLNLASIALHQKFGFTEVRRPFAFPGATFSGGGVGVLFRACLADGGMGSDRSWK